MNLFQADSCTFRSVEDMLVGAIDFAFIRLAKRNGVIDGEVLHIVRHSLGDIDLHKHIQSSQGCKHRIEQLIKSRLNAVECPDLTVLMRQAGGIPPHRDVARTSAHMRECKYCRMEIEFLRKLLPSNAAELNRLYLNLWGTQFDPPFGTYENQPRFIEVSRGEFDQEFSKKERYISDSKSPVERLSDDKDLNDLFKPLRNPESEI